MNIVAGEGKKKREILGFPPFGSHTSCDNYKKNSCIIIITMFSTITLAKVELAKVGIGQSRLRPFKPSPLLTFVCECVCV